MAQVRQLDCYGKLRKGDNKFIPFLYPGQYVDVETELAYNRFRYYDAEVGNYISKDPIGLAGGKSLYSYCSDNNKCVDIFGLSPWDVGKFGEWFDKASPQDILDNKSAVESALRGAGGRHEHFPVSMAAKARELGFTHSELSIMSDETTKIQFENVLDSKGQIIDAGRHPSPEIGDKPRIYNSRASRYFHAGLADELALATTKEEAKAIIAKHNAAHLRYH